MEINKNLLNYYTEQPQQQTIKELNEKALLRQKIRENITQQDIENYLEQKKGERLKAEQEEKGFFTGVAESINLKSVPYLGNLIEGRESEKAVDVILKAKHQPELLTKEEITDFDKYMNELNNQNLAGEGGILYRLGKGALPTIKYSLEYALNTAVVGNSIGGSLITSLEPTRLYKNYQAKQLQGLIDITDKGKMFFSDLEKKPFLTTVYKAYATSLASDVSEKLGDPITNNPLTRSVIGKTTGVKKKILEALFGVSKRTGESFGDLVNGLIPEHLESYIEEPLAQILGANENEYTWDNLAQALERPSWDEFLLTTGMITIQGFTGLAMQKMVGKMQARKVKQEDIETYMKTRKQEDVEKDLKRLSEAEQQQFNAKKEQYKQDLRNTTNYTEEQINENMNLYDKVFSYGYMNFNDKDLSVNEWIEQYGFKILDNVKNSDVLNQTAYHGTPYDFDKFTLDHIGAGEGAQAHGWGLYFALNKKTAKGYKSKLKNTIFKDTLNFINKNIDKNKDYSYWENVYNFFEDFSKKNKNKPFYLRMENLEKEINKIDKSNKQLNKNINVENKLKIEKNNLLKDFILKVKNEKAVSEDIASSKLYKVEIPNDDVMLFENKNFEKQPEKIKQALKKILKDKSLSEDTRDYIKEDTKEEYYTGRDLYDTLRDELGSDKLASELLNKYGIKGIRYTGGVDGECAVVFDDNAIDILDKFNQSQNKKILGQYDVRERIISLSKESNPTTFQHEMIHWWKSTIQTFAEQGNKQAQADLNILNKYVGAETNNWNREQEEIFARSWEQYLRKGVAPTKELQTVFDKIRNWFIEIYKSAKDIVVNGKPVKLDNNIINYFDNLLSLEPNKNIELDYNIKYDRLQNEVDNARETLYQEQPDFTEEEINAILRERFKEQLTPLEELQFKIEQENKKSIKQKVNDIFDTYQYDKKEFSEITNRVKDKIDNINKTLKNLKNKDLNVGNVDNMDIAINDLIEIQKVAKQRLPRRPQTLTQWIKSIGGVYDEGDDLSQLEIKGLTRKSRYKKYGKDYIDLSLDTIRESAIERGFDIAKDTTVSDFINSISDDVGGNYIYRNQDMGRVAEYEQRLQQQEQAQEILDRLDVDVDSIIDLYKKAKQNNLKLLDKDKIKLVQEESRKAQEEVKNILKEIQSKEKTVKKELETKIKEIQNKEKTARKELEQKAKEEKQSIKNIKSKVIDMINNSNLENNDKAKFLNTIKKINSESDFEKQKDFILERIKNYETAEVNRLIKNQINKELDTTKDLKKGNRKVGRYEYQDNLLFKDLRQFNKNNKSQNEIELLNLLNNTPKNEINSTLFNIKERFLNYKINGVNNSIDFSKQVLKDIVDFKNVALENKQEIDNIKFNNKTFDIQEINNAVQNSKANKDTLKTKITNTIYRTHIANIYSLINSITNKTVADKYNIEVAENNKSVALFTRVKQLKEDLKSALDIKQEKDIFKYLNENRSKKFVLTDLNNSKQDINKMHILNIYAEMQNPLRKKQYINNYGESQINDLLNNLTEYDKKVADVFIKHFNEDGDYDTINKFYIKYFNKDLKKVDGVYIPSKSEFIKEEDFFNTFIADNVNSFSSLKERQNNEFIKPIPQDLYNNYIRHINQVEYIDKVAPTFKKIESLFINDNKNKNDIKYKFGDSVFETLKKQLNSLSFISDSEHLSDLDKIFNKIANNWIVSKIGFNPVVFIKQLSSVFGYAENVNVSDWSKNLIKGMAHPKETIDYMKSNFPSIEIRYKNGFNETLNRVNEFTKLGSLQNDLIQASTFLTRMGDAGSVIFGGYAQIQTDLQNGLSKEQAFKNFEIQTMRSQQSGFNSSLSLGQQNKNFFKRLFYAFKNSPLQYLRKIYDSIIMYQNGDIDSKQLAKTLTLYLAVQPAIYRLLTEWGIDLFTIDKDDDEEESLAKGVMAQIMSAPFDGIAGLSEIINHVVNSYMGLKTYQPFQVIVLDDIEREFNRMKKEDLTFTDYLNFVATTLELGTGAPIKNINRTQRAITGNDLLKNNK